MSHRKSDLGIPRPQKICQSSASYDQNQLARRAGVGPATLQRIERSNGIVKGNFSTILKIQKALEQAGIHFTEGDDLT
jgi:predicted transcriptional regulator